MIIIVVIIIILSPHYCGKFRSPGGYIVFWIPLSMLDTHWELKYLLIE